MSRRCIAFAVALLAGPSGVWAQNLEAIKERRAVMETIARTSAKNFAMVQGRAPFDLAAVQANLKTMREEMPKFKPLFPDDAKTGGETDASPKIWQARAEFDKAIADFGPLVTNVAGAIKDEASLKTEYPRLVREGCGSCHKDNDGFAPRLSESFKKLK